MKRDAVVMAVLTALVATAASLSGAAIGATHNATVKPKPGSYAGEVGGSAIQPIDFTATRKTISNLTGSAPVTAKCQAQFGGGFSLPEGVAKIHHGHFAFSARSQFGATVGAKGRFTSRSKVAGKVSVTFTNKNKPCSKSVHFVATRTK